MASAMLCLFFLNKGYVMPFYCWLIVSEEKILFALCVNNHWCNRYFCDKYFFCIEPFWYFVTTISNIVFYDKPI
jgi:hypothetical protein